MSKLIESLENDRHLWAIGLDVGGTKTTGGVVGANGQLIAHQTIPTLPSHGGQLLLDRVTRLVQELIESHYRALHSMPAGIGISLCELVDDQGLIASSETLRWQALDIRANFSKLAPTIIESDVRAAAWAEGRFGAGRELGSFLYVTIGTGISCSLVIDGKPFLGARGLTGTMASGRTTILCNECGRLSSSVLEQVASGPAIARRYTSQKGASVEGGQSVLKAAEAGDPVATSVIESAADCLGSSIGQLVSVLDPSAVVIGGGLGSAHGPYWQRLQESTRHHIWSTRQKQLPILQGELGNLAAVIGAAMLSI